MRNQIPASAAMRAARVSPLPEPVRSVACLSPNSAGAAPVAPALLEDGRCSWPAEDIARLRKLWPQALTCAQIGAIMGRTKGAISGAGFRLKLPPRPIGRRPPAAPKPRVPRIRPQRTPAQNDGRRKWSDAARAELRGLWARDLSAAAIAEVMDRTLKSVRGCASMMGLPQQPKPARPSRAMLPKPIRQDRRTVVRPPAQDRRFLVEMPQAAAIFKEQAPVRLFDVPDDIPALREGCRWPMWPHAARPVHPDHLFCEAARYDTRHHYCPGHAERAFVCRSGVTG